MGANKIDLLLQRHNFASQRNAARLLHRNRCVIGRSQRAQKTFARHAHQDGHLKFALQPMQPRQNRQRGCSAIAEKKSHARVQHQLIARDASALKGFEFLFKKSENNRPYVTLWRGRAGRDALGLHGMHNHQSSAIIGQLVIQARVLETIDIIEPISTLRDRPTLRLGLKTIYA